MTTTILLARHGENDFVGHTLAGWMPGVHLNERGWRQAERLAELLGAQPIAAVYSSPLERARETAEPLARRLGLQIETLEAVGEVRMGEWTNRSIVGLHGDPAWQRFNTQRSTARIPGGETMLEVQGRMVEAFEMLRSRHPDQTIAVISHGDPIRALIAYYLGMPLDLMQRLEIETATVNEIRLSDWGPQVIRINERSLPLADARGSVSEPRP